MNTLIRWEAMRCLPRFLYCMFISGLGFSVRVQGGRIGSLVSIAGQSLRLDDKAKHTLQRYFSPILGWDICNHIPESYQYTMTVGTLITGAMTSCYNPAGY